MKKENCIQDLIKAVKEQDFKLQSLNLKHYDKFDFIKLELLRSRQVSPVCKATDSIKLNFESVQELCDKGTASKFFKVGDKLTIPHLHINSCNGFEKINLEKVPVIAVDVRKDGVLFNFENMLFRHCIDDDYEEGGNFEETELGVYLKGAFKNALEKAICVGVYDCSLLTKEQVFEDLEYFKPIKNRIKVFQEENDIAWWWLSTPSASNATNFCNVNFSGYSDSVDTDARSSNGGVAPVFLITAKKEKVI